MRMSNRVVQVYTKPNSVHFSGSAQVHNENDFVELKPWAVPCGTKLSTALGMFFFCVCVCVFACFGVTQNPANTVFSLDFGCDFLRRLLE